MPMARPPHQLHTSDLDFHPSVSWALSRTLFRTQKPGGGECYFLVFSKTIIVITKLRNLLDSKEIQPVHPKGNQS